MGRMSASLVVMLLVFGLASRAQAYSIVTLDVPGARITAAEDINDSSEVVGWYTDSTGTHGFIYDGSTYTQLDFPDALYNTRAFGINDSGVIVGWYYDNDNVAQGFKWEPPYDETSWTKLTYPGASFTAALSVNDNGVIVGRYSIGSVYHGFVYNGSYTTLDPPGVTGTVLSDINDFGKILVLYRASAIDYSLIYDGSFTSVSYPGAAYNSAMSINDSGAILGRSKISQFSDNFGFVLNDGTASTLSDPPGARADTTFFTGLNDSGDIVGYYSDSSNAALRHSFLATVEDGDPTFGGVEAPLNLISSANYDTSGDDGDPINTFTGELFNQYKADIALGGPMPLSFSRYYASGLKAAGVTGSLGDNWTHNFAWSLVVSGINATITSDKGRSITFTDNGSSWDLTGSTSVAFQFAVSGANFELFNPNTALLYTFDIAGDLIKIEDSKGNSHTLSYTANDLISVTDGLGRTLTFTYASGKLSTVSDGTRAVIFTYTVDDLTQVTDVLGNDTFYAYDPGGLMTSWTLPVGNTPFSQTWNGSAQVDSQTDSNGNTTTFAYAAPDTTITDALGNARMHSHSTSGELSSSTDRLSNSVTIGSDADGRRDSITDRLGGITTMSYHAPSGKLASQTNADGSSSSFTYTARAFGNVTQYDLTGIINADGTTESLVYDSSGNLILRTDRAGNISSSTYNGSGLPLTITNSALGITTYTYSSDGTLATKMDPAGNTTTYGYGTLKRLNQSTFADTSTRQQTYDDEDRLLSEVDENTNAITMTYDANGNLATVTDALGNITTYSYDGNDRVLSSINQLGGIVNITYDALGRHATTTDENNNTTTRSYDILGRLAMVTDPNANTTSYTYDAESVITSAADGLGNTSTFTTDQMGRITQETSALGNVSQFSFDVMGRIVSTTDPLVQTTTYSRDSRGLLSGTTLPGGTISVAYTRNSLGYITQITDPNGNNWQSSFNNQGFRTSRTDPFSNVQTMTYDNRNRTDTISYADGVIQTLGYDPIGNLTSRGYSGGGPVFNYSYNANNQLLSANDGPATADNLTQAYDVLGRIENSNGIVISRDAGGRITGMTLATGKTLNYAYDANDNLISVTDWAGGVTSFSYDAADRLTGITRPIANGIDSSYSYDNDNRLVGLTEGTIATIALTRDAKGQITSATRSVPQSASASTDTISTHAFDGASQVSTAGFVYDARGRITADGSKTYSWDGASRLSSVTGSVVTTYTYDALGHRLSRNIDGVVRNYVWNTALSLNAISIERDAVAADLRYFIHTPAGALLYSIDAASDARQFYHFDEMGNTIAITDDSGVVVGSYAFTPYGKLTASTGSLDNPFTWLGQYGVMDEGNGLFYMRARYYDGNTGRFLTRDLIESIEPRSVNPYQYASGNPMRYFDPLGLEDLDNGLESFIDIIEGYFIDQIPFSDFKLDIDEKDGVNVLKLTKAVLGEFVEKSLKTGLGVVKVVLLGGKMIVIGYNEHQNVLDDRSKNEVYKFLNDRAIKANKEAEKALAYKDVDSLSSMSRLARSLLKLKAGEQLIRVQSELAALDGIREGIEKSDSESRKAYLEDKTNFFERQIDFLSKAARKEIVAEKVGSIPSSNREAANEPTLGE